MGEDNKYNRKNSAVKRILQEVKDMQSNPSHDFMSLPLEEDIFEWQFAIRGPSDSEFEGGIYHGRIQLPSDYPLKPPSFLLLTPNGRFETQTKICLSISNHHPEHWLPSWSVRTALVALIAFMPTSPNGALGSLEYSKQERRALAIKSREMAPKYGSPERQSLIDQIHEYMLSKAPPVPKPEQDSEARLENETGLPSLENEVEGPIEAAALALPNPVENEEIVEQPNETSLSANVAQASLSVSNLPAGGQQRLGNTETRVVPKKADDRLFTWAALGLSIAIVVLLLKKLMKANGYGSVFLNES